MTRISLATRLVTMSCTFELVAGCGGDNAAPASTVTAADSVDLVQGLLDEWAAQGRGGVAVALGADDGGQLTVVAAGTATNVFDEGNDDSRSPEQLGNDVLEIVRAT